MANPQLSAIFPPGTSVAAYPESNWPAMKRPPAGAPIGSATATSTTQADGTWPVPVALSGGSRYFLYAQVGGIDRYVAFTPPPVATPGSDTEAPVPSGGDDATALNAWLDSSAGGTAYLGDGTWLIRSPLLISPNTRLVLSAGATIKRDAAIDNMLRNKSDGTTGGYGQASNISVEGGVFDANMANQPSAVCAIAFGHAEHIDVHGVTIKNVTGYHHLEFNACRHFSATGNRFLDYDGTTTGKEMLQVDLALDAGAFPWFGPYDSTACEDGLIEGNFFVNGDRGVGSHSTAAGHLHSNIRILDNHFETMREQAVYLYGQRKATVVGNTMLDVQVGVRLIGDLTSDVAKDFTIADNIIDLASRASSRGIWADGNNVTDRKLQNIKCDGNTVRNATSHGIGFDYCRAVSLNGNHVFDNGGRGIYIFRTDRVSLEGNHARGNVTADIQIGVTGVAVTDTQDLTVAGNHVDTIAVADSVTNCEITRNNIATSYTPSASTVGPINLRAWNNRIAGAWKLGLASIAMNDFANASSLQPFTSDAAGTGVASNTTAASDATGLYTAALGTDTTGRAALRTGLTAFQFGAIRHRFDARFRVITALSTSAERYWARIGFIDSVTADSVDGAYFEYDDSVSPNWYCKTASNSVRTAVDSGVAVPLSTFQRFRIDVNENATAVRFWIDDVLVATITTNIPTGAARSTGAGVAVAKTAGTTSRSYDVDYIDIQAEAR